MSDNDEISIFEDLVRDDSQIGPFQAWCENQGVTTPDSDTFGEFEDAYRGEWGSFREYAEELVDDIYDLEKLMGRLAYYFDYEAFARDLLLGGDYFTIQNPDTFGEWVFSS